MGLIADCLRGYAHGAKKHGERNWQKVAPRRYRAALFRHTSLEYLEGAKTDQETGLPHLALTLCNIFILHWFDAHPDLAKRLDEEDAAREEADRLKNAVADRRSNLDSVLSGHVNYVGIDPASPAPDPEKIVTCKTLHQDIHLLKNPVWPSSCVGAWKGDSISGPEIDLLASKDLECFRASIQGAIEDMFLGRGISLPAGMGCLLEKAKNLVRRYSPDLGVELTFKPDAGQVHADVFRTDL